MDASILTLITFLPIVGAGIVMLLPKRGRVIPAFTLLFTLFIFLLTLHLPAHFNTAQHGFQYERNIPWINIPAVHYHVGVDGLSLWLMVLVGLLAPLGVLISWRVIDHRQREFYSLFLLQQTAMFGIFVSLDLMLYYAFWELSLVPVTLLIAIFGLKNGRAAAIKFFLYAFIPSALLLVAILWLYAKTGTFDFVLLQQRLPLLATGADMTGMWLASLAFVLAFAVKVPVFPLHAWLADGISEAPTAVAMILAGKLGLYSLLRFHVGLFPGQAARIAPLMVALGVIGILYGSLLALVQTDLKRLVAYAALGSLSFCVLGIYAFTAASMDGAVYQILSESVSAGALFMLLGVLYERYATYDMARYGGLAKKLPGMATLFVITSLSLIGLPILNGFVGEFLILSGSFQTHSRLAATATLGVILSAVYMLWMLQRVFYGAPSKLVTESTQMDINWRERAALWPTVALMLAMGVASVYWMRAIDSTVPSFAPASIAAHIPNYARMTTR